MVTRGRKKIKLKRQKKTIKGKRPIFRKMQVNLGTRRQNRGSKKNITRKISGGAPFLRTVARRLGVLPAAQVAREVVSHMGPRHLITGTEAAAASLATNTFGRVAEGVHTIYDKVHDRARGLSVRLADTEFAGAAKHAVKLAGAQIIPYASIVVEIIKDNSFTKKLYRAKLKDKEPATGDEKSAQANRKSIEEQLFTNIIIGNPELILYLLNEKPNDSERYLNFATAIGATGATVRPNPEDRLKNLIIEMMASILQVWNYKVCNIDENKQITAAAARAAAARATAAAASADGDAAAAAADTAAAAARTAADADAADAADATGANDDNEEETGDDDKDKMIREGKEHVEKEVEEQAQDLETVINEESTREAAKAKAKAAKEAGEGEGKEGEDEATQTSSVAEIIRTILTSSGQKVNKKLGKIKGLVTGQQGAVEAAHRAVTGDDDKNHFKEIVSVALNPNDPFVIAAILYGMRHAQRYLSNIRYAEKWKAPGRAGVELALYPNSPVPWITVAQSVLQYMNFYIKKRTRVSKYLSFFSILPGVLAGIKIGEDIFVGQIQRTLTLITPIITLSLANSLKSSINLILAEKLPAPPPKFLFPWTLIYLIHEYNKDDDGGNGGDSTEFHIPWLDKIIENKNKGGLIRGPASPSSRAQDAQSQSG